MTEEKRNALKKAAEVIAKWYRNFRHSLQQLGHWLLDTWRKHVLRKERKRIVEAIGKHPAEVIPRHPNCRHQVTPYNPHVVAHKGPMPGHDMERRYTLDGERATQAERTSALFEGRAPYAAITEQRASSDQVGEAMHAAANAAAEGLKRGLENGAPIDGVRGLTIEGVVPMSRQNGKTCMVEDMIFADHKVILYGEKVMLRTLSHYTGHTPTELFNMSRQELEAAYNTMQEVKAEGAQIVDDDVYAEDTTEVAQQARASLERIHAAGYDPQAAEEAKERAREVERELLETRREELQQALRYTKKSTKKANIERQIAEIDQQLAKIPAESKNNI